jgi:hypothetical protein
VFVLGEGDVDEGEEEDWEEVLGEHNVWCLLIEIWVLSVDKRVCVLR